MRRIIRIFMLALPMLLFISCENVFHNDELDFMWRLDSVEYTDGVDLFGKPCSKEDKEGLWFSFARDLVRIESSNSTFAAIGVLTDQGNTLVFDFSMYKEENWPGIENGLKLMGIDSYVSTYTVTELNRKNMILTGKKTVLRLTKW